MILTKMTLENISDVPQICSGTLRIAPRALNFLNLRRGGHWAPPPPYLPPETPSASRVALRATYCHLQNFLAPPPPNPVSAPKVYLN